MNVTDKAVEVFIEAYKLECDHRYDPDAIRAALTAALPHMGEGATMRRSPVVANEMVDRAADEFAKVFRDRPVTIAFNPDLPGSFYPHIRAALKAALASHEPAPENLPPVYPLVQPWETRPQGDDALEPSEIEIHEGSWAIVVGTNAKPAGWIDTHALFAHQVFLDRLAPRPALEALTACQQEVERLRAASIASGNALYEARVRNAELVKALERIERAIGAGISENGGEIHRVKISGKTRIEDGWLVGEFADQFREIMRTIQGIARAALGGQSNE